MMMMSDREKVSYGTVQ